MRKFLFAVVLFLITVVSGINIYFSYQIKYVVDALLLKMSNYSTIKLYIYL